MQLVQLPATVTQAVAFNAADIERRIAFLMRVKALCGPLKPAREKHFHDVIERASSLVSNGDVCTELDLLSLELCDE